MLRRYHTLVDEELRGRPSIGKIKANKTTAMSSLKELKEEAELLGAMTVVGTGAYGRKLKIDYERAITEAKKGKKKQSPSKSSGRPIIHDTTKIDRRVPFWVLDDYRWPGKDPESLFYRSLKNALDAAIYDELRTKPSEWGSLVEKFNKMIDNERDQYTHSRPNGELRWAITPVRLQD